MWSLQVSPCQNWLMIVGSVWKLLYEYLTTDDTYLAFLPLAHILEFVVENSFVFAGLPIGYGKVKTLTDASVRDCKGDIAELRPVGYGIWALLTTVYLGRCSRGLGAHSQGHLVQGGGGWGAKEEHLQLRRLGQASCYRIRHSRSRRPHGRCRVQAGSRVDRRQAQNSV